MLELPERSIVLRKEALIKIKKESIEIANVLTFEQPVSETDELLIYGPYFDFESLEEICQRLNTLGLEYWDDYFDFKEDFPNWLVPGVSFRTTHDG